MKFFMKGCNGPMKLLKIILLLTTKEPSSLKYREVPLRNGMNLRYMEI